jgi:hypothetical protein
MNYLGTATERHGRLKKAQDLYFRGWTIARALLGDQSVYTQDFACKFLRVAKDRGVDESVSADIAKWHKLHGRNTLKPSHFEFCHSAEDAEEIASNLKVDDILNKFSRQCDRRKCGQRAKFTCPGKCMSAVVMCEVLTARLLGCRHIHYCSETCRVADMTDPKVQHHLACILAEPIASSLALKFIPQSPVHSSIRSFSQQIWDRFRESCPHAPGVLPPLKKFFIIALDAEEQLATPVHAPLEQNTLMYWRESAHEVRYSMHQISPWFPCTEGRIYTSYLAGPLCIRRVNDKTGCSSDKRKDPTLGWGIVLDYNLEELEPLFFDGLKASKPTRPEF